MSVTTGTRFGPYEVTGQLGAGGMGEVYRARDARLDRTVAIKVLPAAISRDPRFRERFEREARAISSLSHPHICTLYDIGSQDGVDYLVMEFLEGESLAERLAKGPLPLEQVVRYGVQIAEALDKAHRAGIVHRDLKPGNVVITKSGAKLLDFGLAKFTGANPLTQSDPHAATAAMTNPKPLTEEGTIIGTFQYMAPEQVEGREADTRTDIFALGVLLYEMTTGKRAFDAKTRASLIASILDRDPPPISTAAPMTPPALERVVKMCMAKDPDERWQSAHDVALQLRSMSDSAGADGSKGRARSNRAASVIATLAVLLGLAAGALYWRERTRPVDLWSVSIQPPEGHFFSGWPSISPDGRAVAYVVDDDKGELSLWVRRLDDRTPRRLATAHGSPFWSPDGTWIGYGGLQRVRVSGGQPETIAKTNVEGEGAWNGSGTILFCPAWGSGLSKVPAAGGEPVVVTRVNPARRESIHRSPRFLPDGRRFLYLIRTTGEKRNEIHVGSLDGGPSTLVVAADALVGYAEGYLFFGRSGGIYAQRFDPDTARLAGTAHRVVDNAFYAEDAAAVSAAVSPGGVLAYHAYAPDPMAISAYARSGGVVSTLWKGVNIGDMSVAADGRQVAVSIFDPEKGAADVHVLDPVRGISTRVTGGLSSNISPVLAPDGQSVAYSSDRDGMYDIYSAATDGSRGTTLWKDDRDKSPWAFSPDGKTLVVSRTTPDVNRSDLWAVPVAGGKPFFVAGGEGDQEHATFSPDGRWIAYQSDQTGQLEIFVKRYPAGRVVRVSTSGGLAPQWGATGSEIVFTTKTQQVMAASFRETSNEAAEIGTPKELFRLPTLAGGVRVTGDGAILAITNVEYARARHLLHIDTAWRKKVTE